MKDGVRVVQRPGAEGRALAVLLAFAQVDGNLSEPCERVSVGKAVCHRFSGACHARVVIILRGTSYV